ncbi:alpha/beta hydrolase [Williamsia sp. CHRR-6]|uniref:alpha/beta hydrolase n=1 Tax=Williamsia sp. CHRR-6 TaxID=2835871 RepID=UPI001BDA4E9E|nr:alpha/beta fold hydrolase [Williamsia sp. CHRR-6]MBT0566026.1 alpha/beta fold hydrolase [Williamsia sp. CHRR-6]
MSQRVDVEFTSDGVICRAWLYRPDGDTPAPVILMAHGLGGVRTMRLDAFAQRFVAAGYACLVFDYRYFGDSDGQPRQLLDIDAQLADWAAALAFARTCDGVDTRRIILWGTSFGGGHVLITAARDQHVSAVISQCPFTDGLASTLALDPITSVKVAARALRDKVRARRGKAPLMIATAGAPHERALMTAPDALPGYLAIKPDDNSVPNQVIARIGLDIPFHFPGKSIPAITVPVLFAVCNRDTVAPARATLRHAARAPRGEIRRYDTGHFDIYVGADFEAVVADQIDFLQRHVPVREEDRG